MPLKSCPWHNMGLGYIPVRSPLLRESLLISFPRVTKMFQLARFAPIRLCVQRWVTRNTGWVAPFGDPWIKV